jgi:tetratricopeptide (TPR) repeat protein
LISVDTLRADRLGAYGYATAHTPSMDRLAREGVRFAQASAQVPLTLPSHASLLTGRNPVSHGVRLNGSFRLADAERTLAEILAGEGYRTGAVIASVVLNGRYGLNQGFATYDDLIVRAARGASELERGAAGITERALEWLAVERGSKFFLWVHYFDPHQPYAPPPPYRERYADAPYDGEVAFVDDAVGKLVEGLTELGLAENTLVVLTSDHGEGLGEHDEETHSYFVYETTLRVPLIGWCPGVLPSGRIVEDPVRTVDIVPTILDVLALQPKPDADGTSLLPLIEGMQESLDLEVYGESLAANLSFGYSPLRSLRVGDWKYILAPRAELYDLQHDPHEREDLSQQQPERAAELERRLVAHVRRSARAAPEATSRLALDPATREQLQQLGYVGSSVRSEELRRLDQGLEAEGPDPKDVAQVFAQLAQGEGQHRAGRFRESEQSFREALRLDPGNEYAITYLAIVYGEQRRVDEALAVFEELEAPPAMGLTLEILGKLHVRKEHWKRATQVFRSLLEKEPHNVWGHYYLGLAYRRQGRHTEAIEALERAVRAEPSLAEAQAALAETLLHEGRAEAAVEAYRSALALVPARAEYHDGLGLGLQRTGAYTEALAAHRKALELDPGHLAAREHSSLCLLHLGELEAARAEAQQLLALQPDSVSAMVVLAAASAREGDLEWSELLLRKALVRDAGSPEAWYQLARLHVQRSQGEEAREALGKAVELGGEVYRQLAQGDPAFEPWLSTPREAP